MAICPGLYVSLALLPLLFGLLLQPSHSGDVSSFEPNTSLSTPSRLLLLTAHPDDETFFFGPTLTSLIPSSEASVSTSPRSNAPDSVALPFPHVYSLCFSVGNADGLGNVRRHELEDSLDVIGVVKDNRWVLDKHEFQDNITAKWDANLIATTVDRYVLDYNISVILTFDSYGVSGHPNHISLYRGVSLLLATSPAGIRYPLVAYSLNSKQLLIKYTGILTPVFVKLRMAFSRALDAMVHGARGSSSASSDRPIFVAGIRQYHRIVVATLQHRSQRAWFRWLYMAFSQYMWVNEWERIPAIADGGVL